MSVRIGVDVGGTFTKAVACDPVSGEVVARAVVSTTHTSELGVADGVRAAIEQVAADVRADGLGPIELVTHSTTQAVNALLEGDTARVGVLGTSAGGNLAALDSRISRKLGKHLGAKLVIRLDRRSAHTANGIRRRAGSRIRTSTDVLDDATISPPRRSPGSR